MLPRKIIGFYWLLLAIACFSFSVLRAQDSTIDQLKADLAEAGTMKEKARAALVLSKAFRGLNLDSSAFYLTVAEKNAREGNDSEQLIRIHMSDGAMAFIQGDYERAEQRYKEAIRYWYGRNDSLELARSYLNLGNVYAFSGNNEDALTALRTSDFLAEHVGSVQIRGQASGTLGSVYRNMFLPDSAYSYYLQAAESFLETDDSVNVVRCYINVGLVLSEAWRSYEAREQYRKALSYLPVGGAYGLKGQYYEGFGSLEYRIGNYDAAVTYFLKAEKYFKLVGWVRQQAKVYNELGACLAAWGREDAADGYYRKAYHFADSLDDTSLQASLLAVYADKDAENRRYAVALTKYRRALELDEKKPWAAARFPKLLGIARTHRLMGNRDSAVYYVHRAIAYEDKEVESISLGRAFEELARISMKWGDYLEATTLLDTAKKHFLSPANPESVKEVLELQSVCFDSMGDYKRALIAQREATMWRDSLFRASSTEQLLAMEARYWSEKKEKELELAQKNESIKATEAELALEASKRLAVQRNLILLAFALVLIFGVLVYFLNIDRKRAKLKGELSEIRIQALQAQMNPHFIFNALGSVQLLVNTKNIKEANLYLSRFARLIRLILEHSGQPAVLIADDVKALELYIQLEALRFKFSYKVELPDDLEREEIYVPGMIVQPIVENAVKHGLSGRVENGELKLVYRREKGGIVCEVRDNGIGREAASKNGHKSSEHKSMGMGLIRKRLEQFAGNRIEVLRVTDLYDGADNPAGTKVEVWLPILDSVGKRKKQ